MARLDMTFDVNELPQDEFTLLKDGNYSAVIEQADIKPTKDASGKYIKLQLQITGPTNKGCKLFHNINFMLPNSPDGQRIGRQELRQLMESIGLMRLTDTDELIGKQVLCKVGTRPAHDGYDASNEVKKFMKLEGVVQPTRPTSQVADTPQAQAQPQAETVTKPPKRPWD